MTNLNFDEPSMGPHRQPAGALYVITAYRFNHVQREVPIDRRFFRKPLRPTFYIVDRAGVPGDFRYRAISESELNPNISDAGRHYLAEWSFLLTEYERPFATYPFFVVSSRFHEKNRRLPDGLAPIWKECVSCLEEYGWAYLPSYDREAGFEDLREYARVGHLGITDAVLGLVETFFGVRIPEDYPLFSDFFCNYIGFASRQHLEHYIDYYLPLLRYFFSSDYRVLRDPNAYSRCLGAYRNEKPFTYLLELCSHLFFFAKKHRFAGISYDGIYEVDEAAQKMRQLRSWKRPPRFAGILEKIFI